MAADLQGSKDLQIHETSALSTKMNQAYKSSFAEQRSVNKKYIVEDRTGPDKKYKIATWVMNEYKRFDKKLVCADMSLLYFKIHDQGRFGKSVNTF